MSSLGRAIVVENWKTGKIKTFYSVLEASEFYGIDQFHFNSCLNGFRKTKNAKQQKNKLTNTGYLVHDYAEYYNLKPVREHKIMTAGRGKKITKLHMLDMYTHEILDTFNGLKEACDDLGITSSTTINKCCRGVVKSAHGYKWEIAEVR